MSLSVRQVLHTPCPEIWHGQLHMYFSFQMCLYKLIYYSIEEFYVYTHIMSIFDVRLCVGMFIQEFWHLLRLLILLTLIWWQVSNLSKISRIVLPWIQRAIDSHSGWNHWSIICLSKVSSWVSNLSKEWIWYAKSGISGPGVWSISRRWTANQNIFKEPHRRGIILHPQYKMPYLFRRNKKLNFLF